MAVRFFAVLVVGLAIVSAPGCGGPSAASPLAGQSPGAESTPGNSSNPAMGTNQPQAALATGTVESSHSAAPTAESPTSPPPQRPPADRSTTRPGEAEKITFDDLNLGMQADVVFRPFMISDRVKELEGKRISIVGYMHGGQAGQRGIKEFILLKNTQCKFGPGGQADHLADIKLKADSVVQFTPSPIKVEGTLVLEPFQGPDGNTWSIYRLEAAQVRN